MILHVPFSYPLQARHGKSRAVRQSLARAEVFVELAEIEAPVAALWRAESDLEASGRADGRGLTLRRGPAGLLVACGEDAARPAEAGPELRAPADWVARLAAGTRAPWNPFAGFLDPAAVPEAELPGPVHVVRSGREEAAARVRAAAAAIVLVEGIPHAPTAEPYLVIGQPYEAGKLGYVSGTTYSAKERLAPGRSFRLGDWAAVRAREGAEAALYGRDPVLPVQNPFATVLDPGAFALPFECWHVCDAATGLLRALAERFGAAAKTVGGGARFAGAWGAPRPIDLPGAAEAAAFGVLGVALERGLGPDDLPDLAAVQATLTAELGPDRGTPHESPALQTLRRATAELSRALDRLGPQHAPADEAALAGLAPGP